MEDNLGLMNTPWLALGGVVLLMAGMLVFIYVLKNKDEWQIQRDLKRIKKDLNRH